MHINCACVKYVIQAFHIFCFFRFHTNEIRSPLRTQKHLVIATQRMPFVALRIHFTSKVPVQLQLMISLFRYDVPNIYNWNSSCDSEHKGINNNPSPHDTSTCLANVEVLTRVVYCYVLTIYSTIPLIPRIIHR